MSYDCDVLIVGAGPVGTALALELALHRVSFRIIDRAPVRSDKSRALVIQPRTLELLNRHGAADAIVTRGRIIRAGEVRINKELVADITFDDLGTINTEFPLPLNISQAETERFLDECLLKYGISVERPVTATSVVQDDSGVTTTVELPDARSETIRSQYVVGCDGAHSVVRHASRNITFPGAPYPQDFILCDTHLRDSNVAQDRITLHLDNKGVLVTLPLAEGTVRMVASRSRVAVADDVPTLDQFQAYFTSMTPPGSGILHDPVWLTRFRLHRRCVNRYRDGRLFVAGDAAHIHSPAGGQGMNAGIQDAINLGWKLALALSLQSQTPSHPTTTAPSTPPSPTSAASPSSSSAAAAAAAANALLDSYDLERRPIGQALLRSTDRAFAFISAPSPWWVPLRNLLLRRVAPRVARSRAARRRFFSFLSEFGISYRGAASALVGQARGFRGPVRGGDRVPDGKMLRVVGPVGGGGGAAGTEEEETSLQRVCVGAPHHLLLFAGLGDGGKGGGGGGSGGEVGEGELRRAAERVVRACRAETKVHYIAGNDRVVDADEWYVDPEGRLHAEFGFGRRAGYVLVRPDGYVAHIGPLSKLDQLVSFLEGYLVSAVATPSRSVLSRARNIVWAVFAVWLVAKLSGRVAQRV
jgi:2-polyprenyl-6-methoxyphenol hydroxylase-like FAD-dependent oxidoreductase